MYRFTPTDITYGGTKMNRRLLVVISSILVFGVLISALIIKQNVGERGKFDFLPGVEGKFADYSPIQIMRQRDIEGSVSQ